jgi:hypothetical protein
VESEVCPEAEAVNEIENLNDFSSSAEQRFDQSPHIATIY